MIKTTYKPFYWVWLFVLLSSSIYAQSTATIKGTIENSSTKSPLQGIMIQLQGTDFSTKSDEKGMYQFDGVPYGQYTIIFAGELYDTDQQEITVNQSEITVPVSMKVEDGIANTSSEDLIPTVVLSEDEGSTNSGGGQNVSGLLTASRDVFISTAAFTFGPARFRIRGYDSENTSIYMNGIPMNSMENGRATWSTWGGLNDAMRNRENTVGLGATSFAMGGLGGASNIDSRASKQRKQFRISYANSNRAYAHRVMAIYSTGLMKSGWAISASGSMRLRLNDAFSYTQGSDYQAGSYFLSIEKKFGDHSIAFTGFGAPRIRGKQGAAVQELYDLAGTNYYNPNWGFQTTPEGDVIKRNARESRTHQPVLMLNHEWKITENSSLLTAVGYQFGRNGSTTLDWFNTSDPRPNYYRKLPSFYENETPAIAAALREKFMTDINVRQIDWDNLYNVNRNSWSTIQNVGGVEGYNVTGRRARYVVIERRYDSQQFNFNTVYNHSLEAGSMLIDLTGGIRYRWYNGRNFQTVDDLLGADFYVDIDPFAARDSLGDEDFLQNDLENPNRILKEGDSYGYDYESHIHNGAAWVQGKFSLNNLEFFVAAEGSYTSFWRKGNVRNGRFPNNSFGASTANNFFNYNIKGGATYKIDGRNYVFANASYGTRAPFFRNSFASPRTRDQVLPGLTSERMYSVEGGYVLRAPKYKARVVGYFTRFFDQVYTRSFFLDNAINGGTSGGFVNYIMSGINKQHMGLELAGEVNVGAGLSINAVAAIGEYKYISRPEIDVFLDLEATSVGETRTSYLNNFYVAGTPQMAYSVGLSYRGKGFWFLNVNANYFMRNFIDVNPDRRTSVAIQYTQDPTYTQDIVNPESQLWQDIIHQEEIPGNFTVDLFGGKSFKISDKKHDRNYFIFLNVGISNVLNNTGMRTGGYEQFRFDYQDKDVGRFPNRYYYAYGINYFASITLKI